MINAYNNKQLIAKLEAVGVVFSFIAATLLHFSYDWSNGSILSVLFASANESIWEHVKILTLPYIFWMMIELSIMKISLKKTIIAKTLGLYTIVILTIAVSSLYTAILGYSIVFVDILLTFLWLGIGFLVSYKVLTSNIDTTKYFTVSVFAFILFIVMFLSFTINPPHIDIFKDPITGFYGIPGENADLGAVYLDTALIKQHT